MPTIAQEISAIVFALDRLEAQHKRLRDQIAQSLQVLESTDLWDGLDKLVADGEMVGKLIEAFVSRLNGTTEDVTRPPFWPASFDPQYTDSVAQVQNGLRELLRWVSKWRVYLVYIGALDPNPESPARVDQPSKMEVAAPTQNPVVYPLTEFGQYIGRLLLAPLPDGRLMELSEPFSFIDSKKRKWPVPKGTRVDGASIPQPLWSLIGGPFEGKYRDASVIHDYYCSVRLHPHREVHRVFYDGMRASGVSRLQAKVMYAAVYFAGPKWSDMDTVNTQLPRRDESNQMFSVAHSRFEKEVFEAIEVSGQSAMSVMERSDGLPRNGSETQLHLDRIECIFTDFDPTLSEIERAVDQAARALESPQRGADMVRTIVSTGCASGPNTELVHPAPPLDDLVTAEAVSMEILFEDIALEAVVREQLNKLTEPISRQDMASIAGLSLNDQKVHSVADLQFCTNLEILSLEHTEVRDLSPLAKLCALETLSINGTPSTDLTPLQSLTNLRQLFIGKTQVTDISPLEALINLRYLSLAYSPVANIEPLLKLCTNGGLKHGELLLWGVPLSWDGRCVHVPMIASLGVKVLL